MKVLLPLLLALPLSAFAEAGAGGGNGGGGIVCLSSGGQRTVRLLDLREAEQKSLTITRSNLPWRSQLENALAKYGAVQPALVNLMREELRHLETNIIPASKRLPPPSDTQITELDEPRNCFLEGVADYNDVTAKLTLDLELEALLPETDKAALRFHEALYRIQRTRLSPTNNSKAVRQITGKVFASQPLETSAPDFTGAYSVCTSEDQSYSFQIVPAGSSVELRFSKIDGISLTERTSVSMELASLDEIRDSLEEGLVTHKRPSTKHERRWGSGPNLVSQRSLAVKLRSANGLPMTVRIHTSDWLTNGSEAELEGITRNGFTNGMSPSPFFKKPNTFENFSNYIVLDVKGRATNSSPHYSNGVNRRFTCQRL